MITPAVSINRQKKPWGIPGLSLALLVGALNICHGQTTTVFDVLAATETLTVVGTGADKVQLCRIFT